MIRLSVRILLLLKYILSSPTSRFVTVTHRQGISDKRPHCRRTLFLSSIKERRQNGTFTFALEAEYDGVRKWNILVDFKSWRLARNGIASQL